MVPSNSQKSTVRKFLLREKLLLSCGSNHLLRETYLRKVPSMIRVISLVTTICLLLPFQLSAAETEPVLIEAKRIWDQAPHNAFTDLIRFQDRWYCVFREGQGHVSPDGALRVITSADGEQWESAALITSATSDLRDAKISITPDGQLMLGGAEAIPHPETGKTHQIQSLVWFSKDGKQWSQRHEIADRNFWLWRINWHKDKAYGFGYATQDLPKMVRFYGSDDGKNFKTLSDNAAPGTGYANETGNVFLEDGTSYCLLRRDNKEDNSGLIGVSKPPYNKWDWKDLGIKIGGPAMLQLPDGRFIAAVRLYSKARTSLCWIDVENGKLTEALTLPSGGDTSYAGMVWHDDLLWVSYYSSHEGKTNIYLAKVKFE